MKHCEILVYGLGVMGASLAKNMICHGFAVAAYSKSEEERERFVAEGGNYQVFQAIEAAVNSLCRPRIVFLMVTAGSPVDQVLGEVTGLLEPGDVIIDGGNSYYRDTERRYEQCQKQGFCYLGLGVSGGEKGALYGPSFMAGGSREGWEKSRRILETIAAQAEGQPCCAYIAEGGAGHYVKMVHNGIEYGILELIAEVWYLMKYGLSMPEEEILKCFERWQKGRLASYLMEISICVLRKKDGDGRPLVEKILDVAEQKGTGKWTLLDGIERGVYIPIIYEAVSARSFSGKKALRTMGRQKLSNSGRKIAFTEPQKTLGDALFLGILLCYSQGLELIQAAAAEEGWQVDIRVLADVWRDGCIIRSKLLEEIKSAGGPAEEPLFFREIFSDIKDLEPALRETAEKAAAAGLALPGLASALQYYDAYRMEQMPVNFIQALRDCFGAHTYRRIDRDGDFHTKWEELEAEK